MRIQFNIDTENDAFRNDPRAEIRRIVERALGRLLQPLDEAPPTDIITTKLHDLNGNDVGEAFAYHTQAALAYLREQLGETCPACGSDDTTETGRETYGDVDVLELECNECGLEFVA